MAKIEQTYCPLCGKKTLSVVRRLHGLSVIRCIKCDVEMAIILEPQLEAPMQNYSETTH